MNEEEGVNAFAELPDEKQAAALAWLGHRLTIEVRGVLLDREEGWAERTWEINEVLHMITGQIGRRLTGSDRRYPDEHVARMCVERVASLGGSIAGRSLADIVTSVRDD